MSVPASPTIAQIVAEGLRRGGRTTPTATLITDATSSMFQEVKTDINTSSGLHPSLKTEDYTTVIRGMREYVWPEDAQEIAYAHVVTAPGDGGWIDTAQAGTTTTITLAATFDISETEMLGRRIFTTTIGGGPGSGQMGYCIGWDNTTKIATVGEVWSAPNGTTTYLVEQVTYRVWVGSMGAAFGTMPYTYYGEYLGQMRARRLVLQGTPPATSVLIWSYWSALNRLDEVSTTFIRHLNDHRSLWIQGVATKCNQRYDEDRYRTELDVYTSMLMAYSSEACGVREGTYTD